MTQDDIEPQQTQNQTYIILSSDHAGYELKEKVLSFIESHYFHYTIKDCSKTFEPQDDYPDAALKTCNTYHELLKKGVEESKIIIFSFCGSGNGISIALNKCKGIRAVNGYSAKQVVLARQHNNANALCLGGGIVIEKRALDLMKLFLQTKFSALERHQRRIEKIQKMEECR